MLYFQKRERSPDDELPPIKRPKTVCRKRKRSPSLPPTPPRSPSPPIVISDDSEIEISDSGTEPEPEGWGSEDEAPKKKKFRICVDENEKREYIRDQDEYQLMHNKEFKDMKKTKLNVKLRYKEFFPE